MNSRPRLKVATVCLVLGLSAHSAVASTGASTGTGGPLGKLLRSVASFLEFLATGDGCGVDTTDLRACPPATDDSDLGHGWDPWG